MKLIVLGFLVVFGVSLEIAYALDLTAPMFFENARVLPPGVKNPRFVNVFMSMDSRFNGGGGVEPLGTPLNRSVFWNDVIQLQKSKVEQTMIRSTLNDANLNSDGSPGSSTGQVNAQFNIKIPVLAVGVSDRITLGFALPIFNIAVSADSGFIKSTDGQVWMNKLCSLSVEQCNTAARKMNNAVNEKLSDNGYQPIQSKTISGIGDLQMVGKYLVHEDSENRVAIKSTVIFPTGTAPNADDVLDIPTGDGRFWLGASLIYDRTFLRDYVWTSYGGLLAQMPNRMDKRIPDVMDDPVSSNKQNLTRKVGGNFSLGTSLLRQFSSTGLLTGAGYNFQFQTKATYSGGVGISPDQFSYLENLKPAQALHSATLMAGFSTVEWYQNKKFVYPFQANVVFSHPFLGRNVTTNDVISGELILFF